MAGNLGWRAADDVGVRLPPKLELDHSGAPVISDTLAASASFRWVSPQVCVEHHACPDFEQKREGGRTGLCAANEEGVVMRVAKLLATVGIPALLIAASSPLLANDVGGDGAGGGGRVGGGAGVDVGHGGPVGVGHGSAVSHATPGHAMPAAFPKPHTRGAHHGASSFSPGHAMQAAFRALFSSPHSRGGHHGASSFSPGHPMQAVSSNPPTGHQAAPSFSPGHENASTTVTSPLVPMSASAAPPPVQPLE